jgi:hypothetical protein
MIKSDIIAAVEPVINAFNELGILYCIGGSVASSAYGIARATMDVDMVSNLKKTHVKSLIKILGEEYYISESMILDAIDCQSSFNLIHLETMLKVDIFILKNASYHKESFRRRRKDTISEDNESIELYLVSAEDIILNKLDWFNMLEQQSERQWGDILGVIKVQKEQLDLDYLKTWSNNLGLSELLERALKEGEIKS